MSLGDYGYICIYYFPLVYCSFFKQVKPAILSGFEIQGQRWSNNYVTSFKLGYQPADQLQDPIKYYPTDTNPEVFTRISELSIKRYFIPV